MVAKKKDKKQKKLSNQELVEKYIICESKIETLRKYYKRRENILKQLIPIVMEKGKETDLGYVLKIGTKKVEVQPNIFDKDGDYVATKFKACGVPVFLVSIE